MNKRIKTIGTIIACLALTGTCLAAPHGDRHGRHNAPVHHSAPHLCEPHRHHTPPPPPPPPREAHHPHNPCPTGVIAAGAAFVGGLIGGILGN